MKRAARVAAVLVSVSLVACALPRRPIELTASDFDLAPLVGQWSGVYASPETGRSGTISFTLRTGESTAFGQVVMTPRTALNGVAVDSSVAAARSRQILTISFVRKEGGNVVGTLDPYVDPECKCRVSTTFQGRFSDSGTIEGTYSTEAASSARPPSGGNWRVVRVKKL